MDHTRSRDISTSGLTLCVFPYWHDIIAWSAGWSRLQARRGGVSSRIAICNRCYRRRRETTTDASDRY